MIIEIQKVGRGSRALIECDTCKKKLTKKFKHVKGKSFHYCSFGCYKSAIVTGGPRHDVILDALQKGRSSIRIRYGVTNSMHIPGVREKCAGRIKSVETIEKTKNTLRERYGVDCSFLIPDISRRSQTPEAKAKRLNSWKKANLKISKPESTLREHLEVVYGADQVDVQVPVNGWLIDMYIKPIRLYIQVDGVYWHGLNRSLEEIKLFKNKRDIVILKKYETDIIQNTWFKAQGLRLQRITDIDIKKDIDFVVSSIIKNHGNDIGH